MAVRDAKPAPGTVLRGRGGSAHLLSEAVVLDRAGIRLVIPLDAIETDHSGTELAGSGFGPLSGS
ncbi:hypothetical protein ACI2L1_28160 [Streptomyces sp. NPDC019531]|uniref:hypothetical protein n=1 Tax=Streptomyces sp. NPDC019531 TaxID=3365062 RepID=UPI0038511621